MRGPTVPPNNPIDLQSLNLSDFHLLRWSAQQRPFTVLGALTSMLKTSAQLRLENLALRQQRTDSIWGKARSRATNSASNYPGKTDGRSLDFLKTL